MSRTGCISIRLLGPRLVSRFTTTDRERPRPILISSRKGRALLYFTALAPEYSATRDQLASLLWGENIDRVARQSLRQCLVSLRRELAPAIPDLLVLEGDEIRLRSEWVSVDAVTFAALAKSERPSDLRRAIDLYGGEFLSGNTIEEPEFVDWVREQRDRLQGIAAHVFERQIEKYDVQGNGAQAIGLARQLVALEPLREDRQRRLLELFARYDGRDAALSHARTLIQLLRTELGVDPAASTKALIAEIERSPAPHALWRIGGDREPAKPSHSSRRSRILRRNAKPSLLVWPCISMEGDGDADHFAQGLGADLVAALSCVRSISIITEGPSVVSVEKRGLVARDSEADYSLKCHVRQSGNRLRITAELINAVSGINIFAQRYDRKLGDALDVQDEIAAKVSSLVESSIYAVEGARAGQQPSHVLDARGCVMRAIALINVRSGPNYAFAEELLKRSIELDPECAHAHSLLAYLLSLQVVYGWKPRDQTMAAARDCAHTGLILDGDAAWSHFALGYVHAQSRSTDEAIVAYEKAIALNPNFAPAHTYLGSALSVLGRSEAALEQIDVAEGLCSREIFHGVNNYVRANAHFAAGRHHDAVVFARNSVRESPGIVTSHRHLVVNCALAGAIREAEAALQGLSRLVPAMTLRSIDEALPYVREGDRLRFLDAFHALGIE